MPKTQMQVIFKDPAESKTKRWAESLRLIYVFLFSFV